MNKPIVITGVTQARLDGLVANLKASDNSITVNPDGSFVIEGHGVGASARFTADALTVEVIHKPFYVSMGRIESGLREALEEPGS